MATLDQQLEALLYYQGAPEKKSRLAALLEVSTDELETAARILSATLDTRGLRLLSVNDELELVTSPETSDVITRARKEELTRDLGKAGAETLAIVLYRGPVTKAEVEYIRGVNCSFVLRNLLIRGLIERVPNPANARSLVYRATPDILRHLGVASLEALPEYDTVRAELAAFEARKEESEEPSPATHTV